MTNTIPVPAVARNGVPALSPAAAQAVTVEPAEIVRAWLGRLSPAARAKYARALRQLGVWATGHELEPVAALRLLVDAGRVGARQLALGWRTHLEQQGKATGTIAQALSAVAGVVTAARLAGLVDWSIEKVAPRVEQREDRSGPKRVEVQAIVEHLADLAGQGDERALRDLALVRLLHGAALRVGEVVGLRVGDVQGDTVLVRRKGRRERERVLIGARAAASLRLWLDLRAGAPEDPVFVQTHSAARTALTTESVRRAMKARAKQAGVEAAVRPHGLRHSAASTVARGGTLQQLKRIGGWTTLTSPARYLDQDDEDRRAAIAQVEV